MEGQAGQRSDLNDRLGAILITCGIGALYGAPASLMVTLSGLADAGGLSLAAFGLVIGLIIGAGVVGLAFAIAGILRRKPSCTCGAAAAVLGLSAVGLTVDVTFLVIALYTAVIGFTISVLADRDLRSAIPRLPGLRYIKQLLVGSGLFSS